MQPSRLQRWFERLSITTVAIAGPSCEPADLPAPPPVPPEASSTSVTAARPDPPGDGLSTFGTFELGGGFQPDPFIVEGVAYGEVDASTWSESCTGWVAERAGHVLDARDAFTELRMVVHGGEEPITLVIEQPDGTFACSTGAVEHHPVVRRPFAPGGHKLWVGTSGRGEEVSYRLAVSELGELDAASVGAPSSPPAEPLPGLEGRFGTLVLRADPPSDARGLEGIAGGEVPASAYSPRCGGFISEEPGHVLVLTEGLLRLSLLVRTTEQVTLVLQRPEGEFVCPEVQPPPLTLDGTFEAGAHRVWIGSHRRGQRPSYTLEVTSRPGREARALH